MQRVVMVPSNSATVMVLVMVPSLATVQRVVMVPSNSAAVMVCGDGA